MGWGATRCDVMLLSTFILLDTYMCVYGVWVRGVGYNTWFVNTTAADGES